MHPPEIGEYRGQGRTGKILQNADAASPGKPCARSTGQRFAGEG
jgi:hypothetical protein